MKQLTLSLVVLTFAGACTTLGSMPTTTGISAVPHGRPGGEVQIATVPVFRLSNAAGGQDRNGQSTPQLSALIDPDRWGIPGLILGARLFGESGDSGLEPYIGYRRGFGDVAFGVVGYGTKMSGSQKFASYDATRAGLEVMSDAKVGAIGSWGEIHAGGSLSGTYLSADGSYCVDNASGNAIDCADETSPLTAAELSGVYGAATLLLALDIARRPTGVVHVVRIGAMFSVGNMPRLVAGQQESGDVFVTGGLGLSFGFGKAE